MVVIVLDLKQVLTTGQIWEEEQLEKYYNQSENINKRVILRNQMRINSDETTFNWIRNLIDNQTINKLPKDSKGYEIKVFDSPNELEVAIKDKAQSTDSGISRMLATFDWKYNNNPPKDEDYWRVKVDNWSMPWNYQIKPKRKVKDLPWVEQEQTIDEIGSTFSIQGLDLNYAGVIIGPSVKYRWTNCI